MDRIDIFFLNQIDIHIQITYTLHTLHLYMEVAMAKKTKNSNTTSGKMFSSQKAHTAGAISVVDSCKNCANPCPCAQCPQRVLVVGGIERMEPLYRQVIEAKGHIFEYHAGHLRKGGNKLENLL